MWAGVGHFSAKLNISLAWLGDRLNQLKPGNQCSSVVELKTGRLPCAYSLYWSTSFTQHLWNLTSFKTLFRSLSWLGLRLGDRVLFRPVLSITTLELRLVQKVFFQQGIEIYGFFYDEPPILVRFEPSNMLRTNAKHVNMEKLHELVLYEEKIRSV